MRTSARRNCDVREINDFGQRTLEGCSEGIDWDLSTEVILRTWLEKQGPISGVLMMDMKSDGPVTVDVVDNFKDWRVEAMEATGHSFNYKRSPEEKGMRKRGPQLDTSTCE